ncbi:MAG TPA: UrcA family protein [Steroidobacteraceae bacterium]|nr:UrcA family protein [Steroidobacteraceae bacterium]
MSTFIPKSALLLAGAIGYLMAAGTASAADPAGDPPSVVVRFSSDELTTDSGAHAVYRRLVAAAYKVCPQNDYSIWLSERVRACRAQAIARAVAQINSPRLAAQQVTASTRG